MKFLSDRMTSASGSIGGTTFAHNRGGLYTRARRVPVNRRTAQQEAIRNALSSLQARFPTLTLSQRNGWAVYGENVTVVGALGTSIKLTAQQWYVSMNTYRVQAGLAIVDDAPSIFDRATLTPPEGTITAAGTTTSVAFNPADDWAIETGGALLVYVSRPQNATKNFFVGPYQFAGVVDGDTMTPPTSPATITLPFVSGPTGSKQFFKFVSVRADGRTSTPFRSVSTV